MYSKVVFLFLVGIVTLLYMDIIKNRCKNFMRYKFSSVISTLYFMR
jgi:hypothetical protein